MRLALRRAVEGVEVTKRKRWPQISCLLPVYIDSSGGTEDGSSVLTVVKTAEPPSLMPGHPGEDMESHGRDEHKGPVLHIVVVGFHHKKGCQVRQLQILLAS